MRVDSRGNCFCERARVADTRSAAKPDNVEAKRVEVFLQAGFRQIFGNDLAAGRKRGLDPWLDLDARFDRVTGKQTGTDHDIRI